MKLIEIRLLERVGEIFAPVELGNDRCHT